MPPGPGIIGAAGVIPKLSDVLSRRIVAFASSSSLKPTLYGFLSGLNGLTKFAISGSSSGELS